MNKLPELPALSAADLSALSVAGEVLKRLPDCIIGRAFIGHNFIFRMEGGELVSGQDENLETAYSKAAEKYRDYVAKPRPITSAVAAVNLIRERIDAGEDALAVLGDISVA